MKIINYLTGVAIAVLITSNLMLHNKLDKVSAAKQENIITKEISLDSVNTRIDKLDEKANNLLIKQDELTKFLTVDKKSQIPCKVSTKKAKKVNRKKVRKVKNICKVR